MNLQLVLRPKDRNKVLTEVVRIVEPNIDEGISGVENEVAA